MLSFFKTQENSIIAVGHSEALENLQVRAGK